MNIDRNTNVADLVKENFKVAGVFEKYNIDYCCNGNTSIIEACNKLNLNIDNLIPEIISVLEFQDADSKFIEYLSLDELCDYIEKRHHVYVKKSIPTLNEKLQKIYDIHGKNHPELKEIWELFEKASENLTIHMQKEEIILFPYIKELIKRSLNKSKLVNQLGEILGPINQMEDEHRIEGERFEKISKLSNNYEKPEDGCNTYHVTMQLLNEFEKDLHRHIHLENNILFKKAIKLEQVLIK